MINKPLKLRLRVSQSEDDVGNLWYGFDQTATLEFENPLDGTWHPIEVVGAETTDES